MLSIFETLGEAVRLYFRHFWFMVIISIMMAGPDCFSSNLVPDRSLESQTYTTAVIISLGVVISYMAYAMEDAVVLGLLSRKSDSGGAWPVVWNTIKAHVGTLFQLEFLIMIVAGIISCVGAIIVFTLYRHIGRGTEYLVFIFAAIEIIFIKFALAAPLVVVENLNAWKALRVSWEMTKGNFVYVAGCYITIWGAAWLLSEAIVILFLYLPFEQISALLVSTCNYAFDPLWVVAAWCMYHRIKALERKPETPVVAAN